METRSLYGYDLDEIDSVAAELFEVIAEAQVPTTFAILSLCRAITMIGSDADLDLACVMIDQIRDLVSEDGSDDDTDADMDAELEEKHEW